MCVECHVCSLSQQMPDCEPCGLCICLCICVVHVLCMLRFLLATRALAPPVLEQAWAMFRCQCGRENQVISFSFIFFVLCDLCVLEMFGVCACHLLLEPPLRRYVDYTIVWRCACAYACVVDVYVYKLLSYLLS